MKKVLLFLRNRFFEGLFLVIPILGVFFLLKWIFTGIHGLINRLVVLFHLQFFLDLHVWMLEILTFVVVIVLLLLFSVLLKTFLGRVFRGLLEKFFESFPGIGSIYGGLRQISQIFLDDQPKDMFQKVVLVHFPRGDKTKSLGFLMGRMKNDVLPEIMVDEELFVVYIPTAPFPTTGFLLLFKKEDMQETNLTWEHAVRIIFSGGILDAD